MKIFLTLLIVVLTSASQAQTTSDAAFGRVRAAYDGQNWEQVSHEGDLFRQTYQSSKHESEVVFMVAHAALNLRRLDVALAHAKLIHLKFPDSPYHDDARWIMAECGLLSEQWDLARDHFNWILGFAQDEHLRQKAQLRLDELNDFLKVLERVKKSNEAATGSALQVAVLLPFTSPLKEQAEDFLTGFRIRWADETERGFVVYDTEGDPVRAARLVKELALNDSICAIVGGLEASEAAALAAIAEAVQIPFLTTSCGISGLTAIGRNVFQGRADNEGIGRAIAQHALRELDSGNFGILAPNSQEGRQIATGFKSTLVEMGASVLAEELYYPGTMDLKEYFGIIRHASLRYAFNDSLRLFFALNGFIMPDTAARIAYLWPRTAADSSKIEDIFQISDTTWVPLAPHLLQPVGSEPDLDQLFNHNLPGVPELPVGTETFFLLGAEDTTWTLSMEFLDSLWFDAHQRLRTWMVENEQEIDSLEIPLEVFDAFLLVLEPDQIEMIAPQFARANIRTQLLGGELWADRDALRRIRQYVDGLIYAEPMSPSGGPEYYAFAEQVAGDSTSSVGRYHLAGERAARMLLFALDRSANANDMRIALSQIRDLKTLSGTVSLLKEQRIDRKVGLVRFRRGEFEVIGQ